MEMDHTLSFTAYFESECFNALTKLIFSLCESMLR